MTTPLNDADERRLVDAVATAWYGGVTDHWRRNARMVIGRMREQKITLTIEPEPEPVYVWRMSRYAREAVLKALADRGDKDWWDELYALTPEER